MSAAQKTVRFLVSIASAGWAFAPGQVGTIDAREADRLIAAGFVEAVEEKAEAPKEAKARKRGR